MSGLAATETRLDQGAVNVRIGEARTAEVLRNLCFRIHEDRPDQWKALVEQIDRPLRRRAGAAPLRGGAGRDHDELPGAAGDPGPLVRGSRPPADPAPSRLSLREPRSGPPSRRAGRAPRNPPPAPDLPVALRYCPGERRPGHRGESLRGAPQRGGGQGPRRRLRWKTPPPRQGRPGESGIEGTPRNRDSSSTTRRSRRGGCSISKVRRTSRFCGRLREGWATTRQSARSNVPSFTTSQISRGRSSATSMA